MIFVSYYVNGKEFCKCDKNGIPITDGRAKRRNLKESEEIIEQKYINKMQKSGFLYTHSSAAKWMGSIVRISKPSHFTTYSIAKFFSMLLDLNLTREAYRRRESCLFWLEEKLDVILKCCSEKTIFAISNQGKIHKFISMSKSELNIEPNQMNSKESDDTTKEKEEEEPEKVFEDIPQQNIIDNTMSTSFFEVPTKENNTRISSFPIVNNVILTDLDFFINPLLKFSKNKF